MARFSAGIAAAFVLATMASSPAYATYIDLRAPTNPNAAATNGNSYFYVSGSGVDQIQLRASAWSIDTTKSPDLVQNAILRSYTGGLGIQNQGETNVSPDHSIDNSDGWIDFLVLQFDRKVNLSAIDVGWYSGDADATIGWGSSGVAWNVAPALNNTPVSVLNSLIPNRENSDVSDSTGYTGSRDVITGNVSADTYVIFARNPTNRYTDYFKVKGIAIEPVGGVPEPATWAMMLIGFGAIGYAQRRRRAVEVKVGFTAA